MNKNNSLKNKLSNLVAVDCRDYAIFAKANNQHLSLQDFIDKQELENFINNDFDEINLNINLDFLGLKKDIENSANKKELYDLLKLNKISIPFELKEKIELFFNSDTKKLVVKYSIDYLNNLKQRFASLQRKAREIQRDKGSWNLYIAKYFLKGQTPNATKSINAPLILFQVEIVEYGNRIKIKKINNENDVNEKIFVFLQRDIKKQKKLISEIKKINDLSYFINELSNVIEMEIKKVDENDNNFISENSSSIAQKYANLVVDNSLCIGIFEPSGGKLKEELENILNSSQDINIFDVEPKTSIDEIENDEINNDPVLQIDKLDLYQRYAVRSSLINNTIIHGPPGTGKSEVISNIIANILFAKKDVMIVSEKRAALDVLKKRLKNLKTFMLSIYDLNDKPEFYDSIKTLASFLGNSWIVGNINNDTNNELNEINKKIETIKQYKYSITKMQEFNDCEYLGYDFKKIFSEINQISNNEIFQFLYETNFIETINKKSDEIKFDFNSTIDLANQLIIFLKQNNLFDKQKFDLLYIPTNQLVNYCKLLQFDFDDKNKINDVIEKNTYLEQILRSNLAYKNMLFENYDLFYNDISKFEKIKNNLLGIVNDEIINKIDDYKIKLISFMNVFNSCKSGDKKYILDIFLQNGTIEKQKPFSKIFYKKKLTEKDEFILDQFKQLNELNLQKYDSFSDVLKNKIFFNPLSVLYYFNKEIFSHKNIEFVKNKFYLLDFEFIESIYKTKINNNNISTIKKLLEVYKFFVDKFPEFVSTNLFTYFIDKNKDFNWENFSEIISLLFRKQLLTELSQLNNVDKNLVQKAIHVANLSRRPSIYAYMQQYGNVLKKMFPIWVTRPEQVALFIPFEQNYFEYGIYDEASQMFLERAYPLLFRSKINIVAGDDKQLKPTNFFVARNSEEFEDEQYSIDDLDIQESLLDRAKTTSWVEIMLKNHYRSKSKDLISFSSKYIYDGELNYASLNNISSSKALEVVNVDGFFENNTNIQEATEVFKILEKEHNNYESILIIAFNNKQKQLISNMFSDSKIVDKNIIKKYNQGIIDVINIENVQGNEADLVILSVCYGKKSKDDDKVKNQFGPIIQNGGKNRLNVAITRAKSKMYVVKSMKGTDIKSECTNENLDIFRKFLVYIDTINELKIIDKHYHEQLNKFDSDFEKEVYDYLKKDIYDKKLDIVCQYEVGKKRIDIAVVSNLTKNVLIGIEVDGWKYHSDKIKRFEDYERQCFLEARGYKIFRVLEHEWITNKDVVIKAFNIELENAINLEKQLLKINQNKNEIMFEN